MTLVIMAAGMGSRFGGLKQVEPVGPNNEFILDYSIYDAIKAGFNKVVFIIKEENYDLFRETVGKRIESKIDVKYVFQKLSDVPDFVKTPDSRVKPWGTSHAILAAKNAVSEPFAVINADDFYGFDPYNKIKKYFDEKKNDNDFCMIGYKAKNTMSLNGSVKRGVCTKNSENYLTKLTESSIERVNGEILATPLDKKIEPFKIHEDELVSMNIWGFTPKVFDYLEKEMINFFKENENNLEKCEFLLPDTIYHEIVKNNVSVKVLDTDCKWYGVTYKEDKNDLVNAINKLIEEGIYPENLWD